MQSVEVRRHSGLWFNIAVTAPDAGVALVAFQLARHAGASEATATS
jgi:hypothetical protein